MASFFIPVYFGLKYRNSIGGFFKIILALLTIAVVSNAFSLLIVNGFADRSLIWITGFYDFISIFFWGLAFISVYPKHKILNHFFRFCWAVVLATSLYTIIDDTNSFYSNSNPVTINYLFILFSSLLFVALYVTSDQIHDKSARPILMISVANLLYYASIVSVYVFYPDLSRSEMITVSYFKWISTILLNIFYAIIIYKVGKGQYVGSTKETEITIA